MKRTVCAMLTAAAFAGCQSTGGSVAGSGHSDMGFSHHLPKPVDGHSGMEPVAQSKSNGDVVQVAYNTGHGAAQNRSYSQRVARAVPSDAYMMTGAHGMGMAGHGGPGAAHGPNCAHCQAMGGMGMGPGMGPGMGMGAGPLGPRFVVGRTQIKFTSPAGMKIAWQTSDPAAPGGFTPTQLEVPNRYNFLQARIYRLKITDIENRPQLALYPTLEVYPGNAKVDAYLAHNAVPIQFTDEDFDQVSAGNYVTKVIYLPDAKYQELAIAGVETLVSTRLDPGVDPVAEAHRRGSILAVIRVGSVDLETEHSPPLYPRPSQGVMMVPPSDSSAMTMAMPGDLMPVREPVLMPAAEAKLMPMPANMPKKVK